jgi:predicted ester cyclase
VKRAPALHRQAKAIHSGTSLRAKFAEGLFRALGCANEKARAVSAQNTDRLKQLLLEGFGQGDMSVLDEVVAEDFIEHQQGLPQGKEGLKNVIRELRQAFPDLSYTVVQMVEDGDKVWGYFRARGTNEGPFMGQQPTGKVMEIDVIDISRFKDGKMVRRARAPETDRAGREGGGWRGT